MGTDFSELAGQWDSPMRVDRARKLAEELATALPTAAFSAVLEFGCGTGLISLSLQDKIGKALLVDSAEGMIAIVDRKIAEAHLGGRFTAACRDIADHATFPERADPLAGPFTCAYGSMSLHHIRDVSAAARKIGSLLAAGGWLCIIDLYPDNGLFHRNEAGFDGHDGFDPSELAEVFSRERFAFVSSEKVFSGERNISGTLHHYDLFLLVMRKTGDDE